MWHEFLYCFLAPFTVWDDLPLSTRQCNFSQRKQLCFVLIVFWCYKINQKIMRDHVHHFWARNASCSVENLFLLPSRWQQYQWMRCLQLHQQNLDLQGATYLRYVARPYEPLCVVLNTVMLAEIHWIKALYRLFENIMHTNAALMESVKTNTRERRLTGNWRQAMYVWRNMEALSCNHCCSGKAMGITYFECVFVTLVTLREMRMRHFLFWSPARLYVIFLKFSHKQHDFFKKKKIHWI